jgi:eukaryotic-like serine/threonine-protein kinase
VLYAVRFDARRVAVTSGPSPILEGVRRPDRVLSGSADFSVSENSALAYVPGPPTTLSALLQLALVDRQAAIEPLGVPPGPYEHPRLSPDGKRVAFSSDDGTNASVWIYDLAGTTPVRRLTQVGRNRFPVWSADGERVAFQSSREGDLGIFRQRADGMAPPERLTKPDRGAAHVPESWSPDGKTLLISVVTGPTYSAATVTLESKKVAAFGGIESSGPASAVFSPDGRWVGYTGNVPGTADFDTFVQPFPATGATYQILFGAHPMWTPDGRQLVIIRPGDYAVVSVSTQPTFTFGNPVIGLRPFVDRGPGFERNADLTRDGKRFVGLIDTTQKSPLVSEGAYTAGSAATEIHVVLNWHEELKRLVPDK